MRVSRFFLGVDGGQSSTVALIADENGRVLGAGEGGPSNHAGADGGREQFVAAIESCVGAACQPAGPDPAAVRFEAACLGFSGGPADKEPILRQLLRTARLIVTSDAFIALSGAASVNDLLHRLYTAEFTRPRIASYARLVDEVARQGDGAAREVLHEAARQLSVIALAVRGQLSQPGEPVRASYIGGVFSSAILLEEYRRLLGIESVPPVYGPAAGALLEAYRSAGLTPEPSNLPEFKT